MTTRRASARPPTSHWSVLAPPVAVGVLVLGLLLTVATTGYEITHWDVVYDDVSPEEAAHRNGLADLALHVFARVGLATSSLAIAGLLLSIPGLVRGRGWAHITACALASPFALFCGLRLVGGRGSVRGDLDDPDNIAPRFELAPTWVSLTDTLGPPLLVGGAVAVLILLSLPPVFRRFYPPHQQSRPRD
ncbi:MAG TPA: hypothetical protein VK925_00005, partial [Jiangellaceae bacterium]|nr:hypothetical protein [Jiangellaceae bacterium]